MNKNHYLIPIVFVVLMIVSMFSAPVLASRPNVTYDDTGQYTRYVGVSAGQIMKSLCQTIGMDN